MDVSIIEIGTEGDAERRIREIGADPYAVALMAPKTVTRTVILKRVDNRAANLIKQEMLGLGGEAAVRREVSDFVRGTSDILVTATLKQYRAFLPKLSRQPFGLALWGKKIESALSRYERGDFTVPCGSGRIKLGGLMPVVMGILNVTPDSFSDGSRYADPARALDHAKEMEDAGAGIIDIGGESSRPGAEQVSAVEEKNRILPVIRKLAKSVKAPLSVDTYKPEVARAALDAGASIINDITGLRHKNGMMAGVAARHRAPVIIMHMKGMPRTMQKNARYENVVEEVHDFFAERIQFALSRGVMPERIIIDPGIGFGKTKEHNLELLRRLREFRALGYPIAVGASRKTFIGHISGVEKPDRRLAGSLSCAIWAALCGAHIVRVHDAAETVQALRIIEQIRGTPWSL